MPRRAKGPRLYLKSWKGYPPVWVIRDRERQVSTGCGERDLAGAERKLSEYISQKHEPETRESSPGRILIADVVNIYIREHAPHVKNKAFLIHTASPINEWWGDQTLSTIRARTCRAYVEWRVKQGVIDQTARHDLKTLRAAVNYYHREYGPLDAVPAFTLPAKSKPRERYLSRHELAKLLWEARRNVLLRRFILIAFYTGTRSGAVLGLKWTTSLKSGYIDLDARVMHRAGRSEGETKKRQPPCKIPPRLLAHLRRWYAIDMERLRGSVFGVASIKKSWKTARERAGLGDDVVPHTLRHTCVTHLMQAGLTQWDVSRLTGMSIEMIDRVYGHHSVVQEMERRNWVRG